MKTNSCFLLFALALAGSIAQSAEPLPREWIDPDTGHRIVQLSTEPGTNSLYFTQYAYTAGGTKLLMTTRQGIDLVTLATGAIEHVFEGRVGRVLMTGRKTGAIYYTQGDAIFALDPVTKQSRQLAKLPPGGSVVTVNSDETLAAGSITEGDTSSLGPRRAPASAAPDSPAPGAVQLGGDNYPDKHDAMTVALRQALLLD